MVEKIAQMIAKRFPTYGGPVSGSVHPIDKHLEGKPIYFAIGVDVAEVVKVVLAESGHAGLCERLLDQNCIKGHERDCRFIHYGEADPRGGCDCGFEELKARVLR